MDNGSLDNANGVPVHHACRPLLRPLCLSLLAHGFLLWQAPDRLLTPEQLPAGGPSLHASLQNTAIPPHGAEPPPARSDEEVKRPPARLREERSPRPPRPAPTAPGNTFFPDPDPPRNPEIPVKNLTESAPDGLSSNALRHYHLALARSARQFRQPSQEAREAGWHGRVVIRMAVSAGGVPVALAIVNSSHFPALDRAALEMMRLAADHADIPQGLRGRAFTIDLAVDFKADEDS